MNDIRSLCFLFLAVTQVALPLRAELETKSVDYQCSDIRSEGYLAVDPAISGKRPAVVIFHQWTGLSEHEKEVANRLAKLGYVAFAADVYGKGVRPKPPVESRQATTALYDDIATLRARANASVEWVRKHELVDLGRIAAIGYCFGGTTVIEIAQSGSDINGVVSFHGGLKTNRPEDAKNIKTKLLIQHGHLDPYVPAAQVDAFTQRMTDAGVDWQFVSHHNAVHSFTHKTANSEGARYNEKADRRSWAHMLVFFEEIFAP